MGSRQNALGMDLPALSSPFPQKDRFCLTRNDLWLTSPRGMQARQLMLECQSGKPKRQAVPSDCPITRCSYFGAPDYRLVACTHLGHTLAW